MPEKITQIGEQYLVPEPLVGYPRKTLNNGEWQYEEQYLVNASTVNNYVPAKNSTKDGLLLREVEVQYRYQAGWPNICLLRLVWGENFYAGGGGGGGSGTLQEISYDVNNTITEHKIEDHPAFQSATEEEKELIKANKPTFMVHSVTFSKTLRKLKRSWHPSFIEIVGTVGQLEVPEDLDGATASTWLHTGKRISWTKSDRIEYSDEWTYDAYGWQGTIFPTTTLSEMLAIAKGTTPGSSGGSGTGGNNA